MSALIFSFSLHGTIFIPIKFLQIEKMTM